MPTKKPHTLNSGAEGVIGKKLTQADLRLKPADAVYFRNTGNSKRCDTRAFIRSDEKLLLPLLDAIKPGQVFAVHKSDATAIASRHCYTRLTKKDLEALEAKEAGRGRDA